VIIGEFSTTTQTSSYWVYMMAYISTNELNWSYLSINSILDGEDADDEMNDTSTNWTDVAYSWLVLDVQDLMLVSEVETITETVDDTVDNIVNILDGISDPRQTYGLLAVAVTSFNTVWFFNEMNNKIKYNRYWQAGESTAVLTTILFPLAESLLWLGTYMKNETISYAFVIWSKIN
jgi:hypothetical protein